MAAWSAWLVQTLERPIHAADRQRAALHLVDWLGCAHLGQAAAHAEPLHRWAERCTPGPLWACGREGGLQAADAARFHGSLGSLGELDDVHREALVHPGDTVVPAALALAQAQGCTADELLDALVIGYEAGIRLGLLAGTAHYTHWYSTATTGAFASAMACARLLRLPPAQAVHALALAGMQSAGVWQSRMEPGLAKQVATGHAAQAGLAAAELARAGLTGPQQILEGEHGWLRATGCEREPHEAQHLLQASRDMAWRMHEVSFKPWPACRHVHPAMACALQACAQGVVPEQIVHIRLETYATAIGFADRIHPTTPHEARFSLQHGVAWTLIHGDFGIEASQFHPGLDHAGCAALRERMSLGVDATHERAYPRRFGANLSITLKDGRQLDLQQDHAPGDPQEPLPHAVIIAKAERLMQAGGLTEAQARALVLHSLDLPGSGALTAWWERLQAGAQQNSPSRDGARASSRWS